MKLLVKSQMEHMDAVYAPWSMSCKTGTQSVAVKTLIVVLVAGCNSKLADSKSAGLPAQTPQPAPSTSKSSKSLRAKVSKQAAVASMFKAAKPTPEAGDAAASGDHAQGSKVQDSGPLSKPLESMQDRSLAVPGKIPNFAAAELSCGRTMSGSPAEQDQLSVAGLGVRPTDHTASAQAQKAEDLEVLQHTAMGASSGQKEERSTDAVPEGIDLAEQKQILHELWLEKNALSARGSTKRPPVASKMDSKRTKVVSGNSRQTQIFSMLTKPP